MRARTERPRDSKPAAGDAALVEEEEEELPVEVWVLEPEEPEPEPEPEPVATALPERSAVAKAPLPEAAKAVMLGLSVATSAAEVKEASLVSSEPMAPTIPLEQWTAGLD